MVVNLEGCPLDELIEGPGLFLKPNVQGKRERTRGGRPTYVHRSHRRGKGHWDPPYDGGRDTLDIHYLYRQ